MRKNTAILIVVVLVFSITAIAYAAETSGSAETQTGTITNVDRHTGVITFCPEGSTTHMKLDTAKNVDLSRIEADMKAKIVIEDGMVKDVQEVKPLRPAVGC
jgi:hypothetical protein